MLATLAVLVVWPVVATTTYSVKDLELQVERAPSAAALREVYQDYVGNAPDLEVAEAALLDWKRLDEEGCRTFVQHLAESHPGEARWSYLRGLAASSPWEMREAGRELLSRDPASPLGHKLVAKAYERGLFDAARTGFHSQLLARSLAEDAWCFRAWVEVEPESPKAWSSLLSYYVFTAQWDSAQALVEGAEARGQTWVSPEAHRVVLAGLGDIPAVWRSIWAELDRVSLPREEKEAIAARRFEATLRRAKAYGPLLDHFRAHADTTSAADLYNLACFSALSGDTSAAFGYLARAVAAGWTRVAHASEDPDLEPLRATSRWDSLVTLMTERAEGEEGDRALGDTLCIPAPPWELTDLHGDTVRLSDLRGSVVVLDFFATWCGPCLASLPILSAFAEDARLRGVEVLSLHVAERSFAKAALLWESRGLAMRLLRGTDEVMKAYQVRGIPCLWVVDAAGYLRARLEGFSQEDEARLSRIVHRVSLNPRCTR